jgi:hypothetical protein
MSMRRFRIALVALVLVASGCSSVYVSSDWDREIRFDRYRTYRWAPTQRPDDRSARAHRSLLDKRIKSAVDRELGSRGLRLEPGSSADLLFVYEATTQRRVELYRGYHRPGWSTARTYREGTLVLIAVDPRLGDDGQVVWQGVAEGIVSHLEDSDAKITEAVSKLLKDFPPQ